MSVSFNPPTEAAPDGYDRYREHIARGSVDTIAYYSQTVGKERTATVYTPPDYSTNRVYNVLYLLHGIGGDETEWHRHGEPHIIFDNLYADDALAPMIVVMPNGRAMPDDRAVGDVFDPEKLKAFETFEMDLLNDLIPHIESNFPVLAGRDSRALAGLSMGGGQSLNIGLSRLEYFAWVGAFSPAPNTRTPDQLVPNPEEVSDRLSLLWISCGEGDDLKYISDRTHDYLTRNQVPHIWYEESGGHDWTVWKNDLYYFSQLIFKDNGSPQ